MIRVHFLLAVALTFNLTGSALSQNAITSVAPDGAQVASASDKMVLVTDKKSNKLIWVVKYEADVQAILYAPTGKMLAAGDVKGHVNMHDARSGAFLWQTKPVEPKTGSGVVALGFAPDGKRVAALDRDGFVTMRVADVGKLLWRAKGPAGTIELRFSADGNKLTAKASEAAGGIQTFDAATGAVSR